MQDTITIDSRAYKELTKKIDFLYTTMKEMAANGGYSKWLTEEETMLLTDLSKRQLAKKRKADVFTWSSASSRKIKYLRKDVEAYLDDNSTLITRK